MVAQARNSSRFQWLLSNPLKLAIVPGAWDAIEHFRTTGSYEEPAADELPPRN